MENQLHWQENYNFLAWAPDNTVSNNWEIVAFGIWKAIDMALSSLIAEDFS
jgi:hypothetical protein